MNKLRTRMAIGGILTATIAILVVGGPTSAFAGAPDWGGVYVATLNTPAQCAMVAGVRSVVEHIDYYCDGTYLYRS